MVREFTSPWFRGGGKRKKKGEEGEGVLEEEMSIFLRLLDKFGNEILHILEGCDSFEFVRIVGEGRNEFPFGIRIDVLSVNNFGEYRLISHKRFERTVLFIECLQESVRLWIEVDECR
jgi:hypothetical protein